VLGLGEAIRRFVPDGSTVALGLSLEPLIPLDASVTLSDPNRILFPETKVVAVVHEPGGAHASPVQGFFKRDHAFYRDYADQSRSVDGYRAWLKRWTLEVPDRATYLSLIDVDSLRITLGNRVGSEARRPRRGDCATNRI